MNSRVGKARDEGIPERVQANSAFAGVLVRDLRRVQYPQSESRRQRLTGGDQKPAPLTDGPLFLLTLSRLYPLPLSAPAPAASEKLSRALARASSTNQAIACTALSPLA